MTEDEYKKQTKHAVNLINALNNVIGTQYTPDFAQSIHDTKELINALKIFKTHIQDTIEHVEYVGKLYYEDKAYESFFNKCCAGKMLTIKWSEIPQKAKEELMGLYFNITHCFDSVNQQQHDDLFNKAIQQFKSKYNIKKIEL